MPAPGFKAELEEFTDEDLAEVLRQELIVELDREALALVERQNTMDDIEYFQRKLYEALAVPREFLGTDEGSSSYAAARFQERAFRGALGWTL